jgi:NADPH2 dehydrogenase
MQGGRIFVQLWALGRANADPPGHGHMADVKTVGPSAGVGIKAGYEPEELSVNDIGRYIGHYKQASSNADVAGFDGIEVHGANGCSSAPPFPSAHSPGQPSR